MLDANKFNYFMRNFNLMDLIKVFNIIKLLNLYQKQCLIKTF